MSKALAFSAASGTHQGDRETQQDRVCLLQNRYEQGCLLSIVADGMGGLSGGRIAADQVMLTSEQLFQRYTSQSDSAQHLLEQIVDDSHLVIGLNAMTTEEQPHSTFAGFLVTASGACHWAHVGDSRIYHFHDGEIVQRTSDHSYVQALVDAGQITAAQALNHPQANILTRCLGSKNQPEVTHRCIPMLEAGDTIMVCSDGVWPYFTNVELGFSLDQFHPREAVEFLIKTARNRSNGRGDNLSLAIVKCN